MDAGKYSEMVGGSTNMILLNHAEQHGMVARAGLDRLEENVGCQFTGEEQWEIAARIAGKLSSVLGVDTGEYELFLCRDPMGVLEGMFPEGVEPATPGVPGLPLETGEGKGVLLWEAVESLSGRYHPVINCRGKACIIDATLATGVRVYPRVEDSPMHLYFSMLDRWMLTPSKMGLIVVPRGLGGLVCEPPSVLELVYLEGVVDYYHRVGPRWVEEMVLRLTGEYGWMLDKAGYTPITPPEDEYRAGLVSLHIPLSGGELDRFKRSLQLRGVRVGFYKRIMRISPHIYNTTGDLDPVLQSLP